MLSMRDQENLVHNHQQLAASKPLNQGTRPVVPKTPGARYPKTPLKIPLRDENDPAGIQGKTILGTKGKGLGGQANGSKIDQSAFITPSGPRTRAPLGLKTTNAKAKALQTPAAVKEEKIVQRSHKAPTPLRRSQKVETVKLNVHADSTDPLEERDVEYAPPPVEYPPYESEDFPAGGLNYKYIEGANLTRGWQQYFSNPLDENGESIKQKMIDKEHEEFRRKDEERLRREIEEMDWSVCDVPETFAMSKSQELPVQPKILPKVKPTSTDRLKGPSTLTARKAATTLSVPHPRVARPVSGITIGGAKKMPQSLLGFGKKPQSTVLAIKPTSMEQSPGTAASRNTIGYTKGRSASGALNARSRKLPRSVSTVSNGSDTTITPARYNEQIDQGEDDNLTRLRLLGLFDVDDDDLEPELRGGLPECLREDEDEEEFVLELGS